MLKLTVRFNDDAEMRRFLRLVWPYIVAVHPKLSKPAKEQPGNGYYRRDVYLKMPGSNQDLPRRNPQFGGGTP